MKKQTVYMRIIIFALIFGFCLSACDLGTGGDTKNNENNGSSNNDNNNNGNNETITIDKLSIKDNSIKSLYVSNIPINSSARTVGGNFIQTLSYINSNGKNSPFFFVSPSGKNIVLEVGSLRQLDTKRILVDFNGYYEITINENVYIISERTLTGGRALIDMESGKIYDALYINIGFVKNNLGFALTERTIYKADLNNLSAAIPLNNPDYYPVSAIDPPVIFGDKIIGYVSGEHYIFDINNNSVPKKINNSYGIFDYGGGGNDWGMNIVIKDLEGSPYYFGGGIGGSIIGKVSIDNDGNISMDDTVPVDELLNALAGFVVFFMDFANNGRIKIRDDARNGDDLIYNNNGIIGISSGMIVSLKRKAKGLQFDYINISTPSSIDKKHSFIKDNYLYYLEGTSIKRLYLASGGTPEIVYTNNRLLTSGVSIDYLTVTGDNLIFYQFADDNITVNTYLLPMYQPGATPVLFSASSVDIAYMVELNF
jgi:hypothetical protein